MGVNRVLDCQLGELELARNRSQLFLRGARLSQATLLPCPLGAMAASSAKFAASAMRLPSLYTAESTITPGRYLRPGTQLPYFVIREVAPLPGGRSPSSSPA